MKTSPNLLMVAAVISTLRVNIFYIISGAKLLSAETCLNYTPLQLAETDEMFSLLSSFQPVPRRQSDSQEMSFSQGIYMDESFQDYS